MYQRRRKDATLIDDRLSSEIHPMQSEDLTARLVRELRSWFYRGLIKPGERLPPERQLAANLRVSRTSLRHATRVLQLMGLLEVKHGSGTYLANVSENILSQPEDLLVPLRGISFAELFEARRAMEAEAAAGAALRATKNDLQKLNKELELMRSSVHDPDRYLQHDQAFHRQIAVASGNAVFLWFFEMICKLIMPAWAARSKTRKLEETLAEHSAIVQTLELRDPEAARVAMLKHLALSKFYSDEQIPVEFRVVSNAKSQDVLPAPVMGQNLQRKPRGAPRRTTAN